MLRPGKRRRLTVVDLRDSDAMFVALMRLLATLQARHPEHKAELNIAERILDGVQDKNRQRIELCEDAADVEEAEPTGPGIDAALLAQAERVL